MEKLTPFFLLTFFSILFSWSQECIPSGLEVEFLDKNGESEELYNYDFSYTIEGRLKEAKIVVRDEATHILKFEKVETGTKITWFWDDEYDSHYLITPSGLFEFDEENSMDIENAEKLAISIENNLLTKYDYSSKTEQTNNYESNLLIKAIGTKKTNSNHIVWTNEYAYTNVVNPFYYLKDLGYLQISADNFVELYLTLSNKLLATYKYTSYKNGEEKVQQINYSHILNDNDCPIEFIDEDKSGKIIYRFSYNQK